MSSKLDYLFKYTSGAADVGDGENEKRKRKQFKKEKKKKKKTTQSKSKSKSLATNLVDEDDFPEGAERHNDDDFDDNNFGVADDGPVVVAGGNVDAMLENNGDGDAMISRAPRGEWKAVGTATTNAGGGDGNGNGKEDSPHLQPKRRRQHDSSSDDDEDNRGDSSRRIDSSKRRQRYDSS
jgi:hypothetical protein